MSVEDIKLSCMSCMHRWKYWRD